MELPTKPLSEPGTDPFLWHILIALLFGALCSIRLTTPASPIFDEVHYVPAAKALAESGSWVNREHPLLGKEIVTLSMWVLGDNALGWRLPSLLFGCLALYAAMRALYYASLSNSASLTYGVLLASGFLLFVHSRIFMLDIYMAALFITALWQCAAACRQEDQALWRLGLAGLAIGLSMGAKWNVIFLAPLPGLAFLAVRAMAIKGKGLTALLTLKDAAPTPGVSLIQAALLLGLLPLTTYWLSFWPAFSATQAPLSPLDFIGLHNNIMALQASVTESHPYQSTWADWMINRRSIWYLYDNVDGAQRGIMLIGNPLTMLLGLPAIAWAAWAGIWRGRFDALAIAVLYLVSVLMWPLVNKPVQFYYHYILPSFFLLAALALACDELRKGKLKPLANLTLCASVGVFLYFHPILSAAPLENEQSFTRWTWIESWR